MTLGLNGGPGAGGDPGTDGGPEMVVAFGC